MKQQKAEPFNSAGQKFLFYYCGTAVYEGDETHRMMERCNRDFGGDMTKMAKHDAKQIQQFFNGKK